MQRFMLLSVIQSLLKTHGCRSQRTVGFPDVASGAACAARVRSGSWEKLHRRGWQTGTIRKEAHQAVLRAGMVLIAGGGGSGRRRGSVSLPVPLRAEALAARPGAAEGAEHSEMTFRTVTAPQPETRRSPELRETSSFPV